jgi:5-aminolevulinate synthase
MLSCPFLSNISKSCIVNNASAIWSYAKYCPIWNIINGRQHSTIKEEVKQNCPFLRLQEKMKQNEAPEKMFNEVNSLAEATDALILPEIADTIASEGSVQIPVVCPFSKQRCVVANMNGFNQMNECCEMSMSSSTAAIKPLANPVNLASDSEKKFSFRTFFQEEVEKKRKDRTYRIFKRVMRSAEDFPYAQDYTFDSSKGHRVTVWCSNDYLGMSRHPSVKEAAMNAIREHGSGSGGTRNISGNSPLHEALEQELASLHGKDSALIFTSCFVANETTLYTLGSRLPKDSVIFSDAGNHASMIHGIRTSGARKRIFRHNDVEHLKELIVDESTNTAKVVAFETVHSMTGDVCPLKELLDVTQDHGGLSFVDEVHAVGLYGKHGAGVAERDGVMHRIDAITGTLGKAFANVGGYLVGSQDLVDAIRSYGAGFIFTTSLPPATLAAARRSIQILRSPEGEGLRTQHQAQVAYLRNSLLQAGLPVTSCKSHIIPVHVGDPQWGADLSNRLLREHHIYVQHINYPTVPRGKERLRIAPTPFHTNALCDQLVEALSTVWRETLQENRNRLENMSIPIVAAA